MKKALCIFIFCFVFHGNVWAWDNERTHRDISGFAGDNSVLSKSKSDYLRRLGFTEGLAQRFKWGNTERTAKEWLQEGAFLEDEGSLLDAANGIARFNNHFHNPLKTWGSAGLSDIQYGESALLWAQDKDKQYVSLGGDWSWQALRLCYYNAITVQTDVEKQAFFACTFEGLGYQMHLIQDMSVPAHTRNDAHPLDSFVGWNIETGDYYLETWAKKNSSKINGFALSPLFPQVALNVNYNGRLPISQFIDSEQYGGTMPSTSLTWGLSEYTNSNFLSDDTIFTEDRLPDDIHYFPYPRYSSDSYEMYEVENSLLTKKLYLKKKGDGEYIEHFAVAGPLYKWASFDPEVQKFELKLDPAVFKDYTSKLIPRAVGYSAGLLNYFFRGSIDISVPSNGLYSMIDATQAGFNSAAAKFTNIKLIATNTTTAGENMTNGTIQLVVKYKVAQTNPFQSGPVSTSEDFSYIVAPEKNNVNYLNNAISTELSFDLSQNPIPLWATDVYLQVVFHGKLGNEDGAVAVGFKDISEPTPIDLFNNMDKTCVNGNWYNAGGPEAIDQVDNTDPKDGIADLADVYAHDLENIYLRFSPYSTEPPYNWASETFHDVTIPYIAAGNSVRAAYILSDYMFDKGYYMT